MLKKNGKNLYLILKYIHSLNTKYSSCSLFVVVVSYKVIRSTALMHNEPSPQGKYKARFLWVSSSHCHQPMNTCYCYCFWSCLLSSSPLPCSQRDLSITFPSEAPHHLEDKSIFLIIGTMACLADLCVSCCFGVYIPHHRAAPNSCLRDARCSLSLLCYALPTKPCSNSSPLGRLLSSSAQPH